MAETLAPTPQSFVGHVGTGWAVALTGRAGGWGIGRVDLLECPSEHSRTP